MGVLSTCVFRGRDVGQLRLAAHSSAFEQAQCELSSQRRVGALSCTDRDCAPKPFLRSDVCH